jgi:inorganic pyrophosphatase
MSGRQESLAGQPPQVNGDPMKHPTRRLRILMLAVSLCSIALAGRALGAERVLHPFLAAQPENVPDEAVLAVEISAGSFTKYEINEDGLLFVDRFQSMPVAYPANYGSMPRTLAGDNDPLDALVLTREPLHPGVLIRFRPIGVLRMADDGEADQKIIGVPADRIDPTYAGIRDLLDLPLVERQRIEAFFRVYKDLPAGRNPVKLDGYGDAAEARAIIVLSLERFNKEQGEPETVAGKSKK